MIIRALPLRHGRHALPRSFRSVRRLTSTSTTSPSTTPETLPNTLPPGTSLKPEDIRDPNHPVAQNYLLQLFQRSRTDHIGAAVEKHYKPHELLSNPPRPEDITLELLLASQAHIGHATSLWHPGNAQYIHGIRGDEDVDPIHIISLDATAAHLRRACTVVRGVTARGGLVLFVGTRAGQDRTVVRAAQLAKGCHLFSKWIPGSITNGQQLLGRGRKKVVDELDREVLGFQDQLRRQAAVKPDLVVCLNPLENYTLLRECGIHNIPTIGIVDTDVNPTWVTYPIPANDDSLRCVQVIAGVLGRAGQQGQGERLEMARKGTVMYEGLHGLSPPTAGQAEKELEAAERELQARQREYEELGRVMEPDASVFEDAAAEAEGGEGEKKALVEGEDEGEGLEAVDLLDLAEQFQAVDEVDRR